MKPDPVPWGTYRRHLLPEATVSDLSRAKEICRDWQMISISCLGKVYIVSKMKYKGWSNVCC